MISHLLSHFELTPIPQIFRDPRGPKAVAAYFGKNSGIKGTPANHPVNIRLGHWFFRELFGAALRSAEEITFSVLTDPGGLDVGVKIVFQVMVAGHLMAFSALFVEAHPSSTRILITAPTRAKV
jgi:hypothetical protein